MSSHFHENYVNWGFDRRNYIFAGRKWLLNFNKTKRKGFCDRFEFLILSSLLQVRNYHLKLWCLMKCINPFVLERIRFGHCDKEKPIRLLGTFGSSRFYANKTAHLYALNALLKIENCQLRRWWASRKLSLKSDNYPKWLHFSAVWASYKSMRWAKPGKIFMVVLLWAK